MNKTQLKQLIERTPIAGRDYLLNLPTSHLSVSQIQEYLRCGEYYRRLRLPSVPIVKSYPSSMFEGHCHHKVLEVSCKCWMKGGRHLYFDEAIKVFKDFMKAESHKVTDWQGCTEEEILARGMTFMKDLYPAQVSNQSFSSGLALINSIEPTGTEMYWEKFYAGVPCIGYVDVLEQDMITDMKVIKRSGDIENHLQLDFYANVYKIKHVRLLQLIKHNDPSKCRVEPMVSHRTPEILEPWLNYLVGTVAKGISTGHFIPISPEISWKCGPKTCQFWKDCYGAFH